jgi:hypothetical protein
MVNVPGVKAEVVSEWPGKAVRDRRLDRGFIGDTSRRTVCPTRSRISRELGEMMQRGCGIVCVHYATGLLGEDVQPDGDHPLLRWMGG